MSWNHKFLAINSYQYLFGILDKHKSNIKIMENFPADVVKAEKMTGGNVNILATVETPQKQKLNTSTTSPATPEKSIVETSTPVQSKKATGAYNSVSKVQVSTPAPKNDKKISCPVCNFSTDRMNLLMFHIKSHSTANSPRASGELRAFVSPGTSLKKSLNVNLEPATPEVRKVSSAKKKTDDSIADDVRKIKESMKKEPKAKKSREPKAAAATPLTSRASRSSKKEKVPEEKVEEKPKQVVSELKKELLADWSDDEDGDVNMETEKKKVEGELNGNILRFHKEKRGLYTNDVQRIGYRREDFKQRVPVCFPLFVFISC